MKCFRFDDSRFFIGDDDARIMNDEHFLVWPVNVNLYLLELYFEWPIKNKMVSLDMTEIEIFDFWSIQPRTRQLFFRIISKCRS